MVKYGGIPCSSNFIAKASAIKHTSCQCCLGTFMRDSIEVEISGGEAYDVPRKNKGLDRQNSQNLSHPAFDDYKQTHQNLRD